MRHKTLLFVISAAVMLALSTVPAHAQRHHRGGHITVIRHSPLLWGGGFYSGFYNPYYRSFAQWYPPFFGYPPGVYAQDGAVSLRLQVSPRDAAVFVDGYAAGMVDDYDGVFQRLRLVPGPHEIVIYHPNHRTLRQHIYYNPGSTHTIRRTLDALLPGESPEPQPVPRALPSYPGVPGQPPMAPVESNRTPDGARIGTLALRVQPGDAIVSSMENNGVGRRHKIASSFNSPQDRTACASRRGAFRPLPLMSTCAPAKRRASMSACCRSNRMGRRVRTRRTLHRCPI